jgi:hypothetical protein
MALRRAAGAVREFTDAVRGLPRVIRSGGTRSAPQVALDRSLAEGIRAGRHPELVEAIVEAVKPRVAG